MFLQYVPGQCTADSTLPFHPLAAMGFFCWSRSLVWSGLWQLLLELANIALSAVVGTWDSTSRVLVLTTVAGLIVSLLFLGEFKLVCTSRPPNRLFEPWCTVHEIGNFKHDSCLNQMGCYDIPRSLAFK